MISGIRYGDHNGWDHSIKVAVIDPEALSFFSGLKTAKIGLSSGDAVGITSSSLTRSCIISFNP